MTSRTTFLRGCSTIARALVLALAISLTTLGCNEPVRVQGTVSGRMDDGTFDPIPGALVTFTSEGGTTYNDTSRDPSGVYSIDLFEGTYTIQVVHPDYQLENGTEMLTADAANNPHTRNLYMTPR